MAEHDIPEIPSNSLVSKSSLTSTIEKEKPEKPEIKPVHKVKKSLGQKFKDVLFGDDAKDVSEYVLWDIVLPNVKKLFYDTICGFAGKVFLGEDYSPSNGRLVRDRGQTLVRDYSSISSNKAKQQQRYQRPVERSIRPGINDFDTYVIESKREAESVLEYLVDILDEYGEVSVNDFYDAINVSPPYTSQYKGWYDLAGAGVRPVYNGYVIHLPKPVDIS